MESNLPTPEPATPDDAEAIAALRDAAARWQIERGIAQWTPGEIPVDVLRTQIHAGQFHVLRVQDRIVAAVRITWSDPPIWTDEAADTAGYVHALVTVQPGAGRGAQMLSWAEKEIGRQGRTRVRLDCVASNARLRAYYHSRGYTDAGLFDGRSVDATSRFPPLQRFEKYLPG